MSGSSLTPSGLEISSSPEMSDYDHTVYENQIVAVYDTLAQAESAKSALVTAGIPASAIQVIDQSARELSTGSTDEGFWGAVKSLFAPDDDTHAYTHAVGHGHALVVVTPDASTDRRHVIQVLESTNPIDFDAKLAEWQKSGYDYSAPHSAAFGVTDTMAGAAGTAGASAGLLNTSMGTSTAATPPAPTGAARVGDQDTIKVMEERLRVGKREVAGGAMRVRSYVVERPVEEQVRLREERVTIERRPVDREASPAEVGAFQERTIEAAGFKEEAVISKEARVVEEIGINKEASERVETVRDTVRKTEVEVEDGTKTGAMGTGGKVTNATPGATSSGINSPRK